MAAARLERTQRPGGCRWLQVAAGGCRWLQVAAGGCRWLQVAAGGCRWLLVVEPVGCMMKNRSSMAMAMESFNAK